MSLGIHDVAVITSLVQGEVSRISAEGMVLTTAGIEDEADIFLKYERPEQYVRLSLSWLWPEKDRRLVIYGETGFIVYNELSQEVWISPIEWANGGRIEARERKLLFSGAAQPLRLELEHFLECVEHRSMPKTGSPHIIASMMMLDKIQTALRRNENGAVKSE